MYAGLSQFFFDPDQRFLMRIRIRPNDTDPTGSGSETLTNICGVSERCSGEPKAYVYPELEPTKMYLKNNLRGKSWKNNPFCESRVKN